MASQLARGVAVSRHVVWLHRHLRTWGRGRFAPATGQFSAFLRRERGVNQPAALAAL